MCSGSRQPLVEECWSWLHVPSPAFRDELLVLKILKNLCVIQVHAGVFLAPTSEFVGGNGIKESIVRIFSLSPEKLIRSL